MNLYESFKVKYLCFLILFLVFMPENIFPQEYFITESYFINDISNSDIDLDGDNDLIICSSSNELADSLYIYYNDGIGNLDKSSICRRNGIFILNGDLDNDQFPAIITKDESSILYIKNNGDGTFGEEIALAPTEGNRVIECIADMDGDGLNDLVYTFNAYYCRWGILKNEGELIFTDHIIYDDGLGTNLFPIIGNLNSDNLPDASLTFTSDGIHVLVNNGDLTFDSLLLCSTKGYPAICTLDLNPPEDILVLAPNTDELILFENMGNNVFTNRNTLPLIDALGLIMYGYSPRNAFKILWNDGFGGFNYENPVAISETLNSAKYLKISPNPFTNKTKINYHLDNEATVQINIFNNLGQLVETITEIGKPKGNHSYDFDASELNTGIYFCALIVNGKAAASMKMMVL